MTDQLLRNKVRSGIAWRAGARIVQQVLQYVVIVVMMRQLSPTDFGMMSMVTVFTGFAALFGELGFGAALIQRKEINEDHWSSVFWLNLATGFVLTLIVAALAPAVSMVYGQPQLSAMTAVMSLSFFIAATGNVHRAMLNRTMRFSRLAIIEFIAMTIASVVAILMVFRGHGVWSLVAQSMVLTTASAVLTIAWTPWRPRLQFRRLAIRQLLPFGSNVLAFQVLNYWSRRADNLLIGTFVGAVGLGIYSRAYSLMVYPLSRINETIGVVLYPAMSRIQEDRSRIRGIYLRTLGAIAIVTFPMMTGLFVVVEDFVDAMFSAKWAGIVPILKIFCVTGIIQSISTPVGWLFRSQGRPDLQFRLSLVGATGNILAFVIGLQWGVVGVAACYTIWTIVWSPVVLSIAGQLVNVRLIDIARAVLSPLICAVAMGVGLYVFVTILPSTWSSRDRLAVEIVFGGLIYIAQVVLFRIPAYRDIRGLISVSN